MQYIRIYLILSQHIILAKSFSNYVRKIKRVLGKGKKEFQADYFQIIDSYRIVNFPLMPLCVVLYNRRILPRRILHSINAQPKTRHAIVESNFIDRPRQVGQTHV